MTLHRRWASSGLIMLKSCRYWTRSTSVFFSCNVFSKQTKPVSALTLSTHLYLLFNLCSFILSFLLLQLPNGYCFRFKFWLENKQKEGEQEKNAINRHQRRRESYECQWTCSTAPLSLRCWYFDAGVQTILTFIELSEKQNTSNIISLS